MEQRQLYIFMDLYGENLLLETKCTIFWTQRCKFRSFCTYLLLLASKLLEAGCSVAPARPPQKGLDLNMAMGGWKTSCYALGMGRTFIFFIRS